MPERLAADFPWGIKAQPWHPATTAYIPQEFPSAEGIAASNVFSRRPAPPCPTGNIPQRTAATQGRRAGPTPMGTTSPSPASGSALPKISGAESAASFPLRIRRSKRALGWGKRLRGYGGRRGPVLAMIDSAPGGAWATPGRQQTGEVSAGGLARPGQAAKARECKLHRHHWRATERRGVPLRFALSTCWRRCLFGSSSYDSVRSISWFQFLRRWCDDSTL